MSEVTQLLSAAVAGDRQATTDLLPLVYDELRQLAAIRLAREAPGQTLQPTALVHEAFLRLVGSEALGWEGRGHFFTAAGEAMRRILVEAARRKDSLKRGGDYTRRDLDADAVTVPELKEDILTLSEALDRFAEVDPEAARLVHLRYFAGLSLAECAAALGVSPRTADRLWAYARAWLREAIGPET